MTVNVLFRSSFVFLLLSSVLSVHAMSDCGDMPGYGVYEWELNGLQTVREANNTSPEISDVMKSEIESNITESVDAHDQSLHVRRLQDLFLLTDFGDALGKNSEKTKKIGMTNSQVYEVTCDMPQYGLNEGDLFYLDKSHGDHLEVWKGNYFIVLNLNGSFNSEKTNDAKGRKLNLKKGQIRGMGKNKRKKH